MVGMVSRVGVRISVSTVANPNPKNDRGRELNPPDRGHRADLDNAVDKVEIDLQGHGEKAANRRDSRQAAPVANAAAEARNTASTTGIFRSLWK